MKLSPVTTIAFVGLIAIPAAMGQARRGGPRFGGASDGKPLGGAHFEIDPDTKSLIVTTDADTNDSISKLIEELDQPVPQALIKVLFLEVAHGNDLDLGADIRYEDIEEDGDRSLMSSLFGASGFTNGGTVAILENDLNVTLSALAQANKMEVLSRPSIMARNNEEATITIGQEVPFIRNTQVTDDGRTINTIEYEDIGIILTVTPHITSTGMVELEVASEISTLTGDTVPISETVQAPTFAKRSADTRVVVPDGKTVVIGGLMENQETETVRKVPILGDIWGVGNLFRRTIKTKQKTELLIFLTPNVVWSETDSDDLLRAEHEQTRLIPETFSTEDLGPHISTDLDKIAPPLEDEEDTE